MNKLKITRSVLNLISAIASNVLADTDLKEIQYYNRFDGNGNEYIKLSLVISIEMYDVLVANNQSFEYITTSKDDFEVRLECWQYFKD